MFGFAQAGRGRSAHRCTLCPRSRTNPQFNADALPEALVDAGITHRHLPALGGLRHRTKGSDAIAQYTLAGRDFSKLRRLRGNWLEHAA
ncbi:MAG: DUF488 family protein [Methylocella sp.]